MSKKLNYYIELLKIPEEKYKINSDGTITISDLNITLQKTKTIVYPPPETPKKKNKRMTDKQIANLIDKKIVEKMFLCFMLLEL